MVVERLEPDPSQNEIVKCNARRLGENIQVVSFVQVFESKMGGRT